MKNAESSHTTEEYDTAFPLYRPVLESLLLGIIQAHPLGSTDESSQKQRLRTAMSALTGSPPVFSPFYDDSDDKYLMWITNEILGGILWALVAPESDGRKTRRKILKLANLAVATIHETQIQQFTDADIAIVRRVYEKYTGIYWRKQKKYRGAMSSINSQKFIQARLTYFNGDHGGSDKLFLDIAQLLRTAGVPVCGAMTESG